MPSRLSVSVITPCYNGAAYLRETLDSAVGQTHPPAEVIVIDDGSTDSSASIAESYGMPVRLIRQSNQGESIARNKGIAEATGDYLIFLDADDLLDRRAIERLVECTAGQPNCVALMGCAWFKDDPSQPFATRTPRATSFFPGIISQNLAPAHCWLVPRDLVVRVGGFGDDIQQFEDWDLWCRIALTGASLNAVDYVGAYYRRHDHCQSESSPLIERCRGHAAVMRRLSDGILANDPLLQQHGKALFWSVWTALSRGRREGMDWGELTPLARNLSEISRRGPRDVTASRFGRLIRLCGVRCAETVRSVFHRVDAEVPA